MHAYRDAIPDARSVWILYPGGQFRFFGFPGGGGLAGGRAACSPEGLPGEVEGVGAVPVGPTVGGEGGDGRGMAAANDGALRGDTGADTREIEQKCKLQYTLSVLHFTFRGLSRRRRHDLLVVGEGGEGDHGSPGRGGRADPASVGTGTGGG